jgi:OmpA-OmpF porin, OOP family
MLAVLRRRFVPIATDWIKGLAFIAACSLAGCSFQASVGAESKTPAEPPPPAATPDPAAPAEPEPDKPAKTSKITVKGNKLQLPGKISFQPGTATFAADSGNEALIAEIRAYLAESPRVTRLRIEGHTDNQAEEAPSLELSGQRASMVKQWLVSAGVNQGRLLAVGFGQSKPVANNATEEGRAENNRIDFRIAEVDGKPYLNPDPLAGGTEFP